MKILFFVDDFVGGAGNVIQILASGFSVRNNEVFIALTRKTKEPRRNLDGVKLITLDPDWEKHSTVKRYIKLLSAIRKTIYEEKPDVIISFLYGVSSLVGLCIPNRIPFIVSERSNPLAVKPTFAWECLRRHAYKKADIVVVQFKTFALFDKGRYKSKVVTIPNPIEVQTEMHKREIAEDGIYRFVTMGNDRPIKGFSYLITAFSIVVEKFPNSTLTIYGSPLSNQSKSLIDQLFISDKVVEGGYTNNLIKALDTQDFYVMPSIQEGFPNSLCEAMVFGMPCAASLCHEGISELITNYVNGITFEPKNPIKIYEAMEWLIKNPDLAKIMSLEARKIQDMYSIEAILNIWNSVIAKANNNHIRRPE